MSKGTSNRVWWLVIAIGTAVLAAVPLFWQRSEPVPERVVVVKPPEPDPASQYDRCEGPVELQKLPEAPGLPPRARESAMEVLSSRPESKPLKQWYTQWELAIGPAWDPGEEYLDNLERMLRSSSLSALEMFDVSYEMAAKHELACTRRWIRVATDRAIAELAQDPDPETARYLVRAMGESQTALWMTGDGQTLVRLFGFIASFPRENRWDQAPEWARIGRAEALDKLKDYDGAWKELDGIEQDMAAHPSCYTPRQRTEIHLARAYVLYDQKRWHQAIPHFQIVADDPYHHHATEAMQNLIRCLCEEGKVAEAKNWYQRWISRGTPPRDLALLVMSEIIEAEQAKALN